MDPDPGGPKLCGSGGSGTLVRSVVVCYGSRERSDKLFPRTIFINKQFLREKNKYKCRLNAVFILCGEDMKAAEYRIVLELDWSSYIAGCSIYPKTVTRLSSSEPCVMLSVCRRFA